MKLDPKVNVLEQGPLKDGEYRGTNYHIFAESEPSIEAGLHWFFSTPVGIAILVGIGVAVFLGIASEISF